MIVILNFVLGVWLVGIVLEMRRGDGKGIGGGREEDGEGEK